MPRISVIMPVYNGSAFLRKSIESVLNQSFRDLELIIIDDGSTDDTSKIIKEFKLVDKRIFSFYQKNRGQSAARNMGIRKAKGKFIAFIDADDYLEKDAYLEMIQAIDSTGMECGMFSYSYVYSDRKKKRVNLPMSNGIHAYEEILENLVKPLLQDRVSENLIMGAVWRFLFNRKRIIDNKIKFSYSYLEDELFLIEYFARPTNIVCVDEPLYNYYQNSQSIIHSYHDGIEAVLLDCLNAKQELVKHYNIPCDSWWIYNSVWGVIFIIVTNEFVQGNKRSIIDRCKKLKEICSIPLFEDAIKKYKPVSMSRNKTIVAYLIRKKLYLILSLFYIFKNGGMGL